MLLTAAQYPDSMVIGKLRQLGELRNTVLEGAPTDRRLARKVGVSPTTIGSWLGGKRFPQDPDRLIAVIRLIRAEAVGRGIEPDDGSLLDEGSWRDAIAREARRRAGITREGAERAQAVGTLGSLTGVLLDAVTDPFALDVHRAVQVSESGGSMLPRYVIRAFDDELRSRVTSALNGRSEMAVLVGGSSTGKTRACWEALEPLRYAVRPWRLWHPIEPTPSEAVLRGLADIQPRTVIWLNELQQYLAPAPDSMGQRIAAGLRELLRNPSRAPILILGTLWPSHWHELTRRPEAMQEDLHGQSRRLISGREIAVPAAFDDIAIVALKYAAVEDPRLADALTHAEDGQVSQYLAGAPLLLDRYRNAPPGARALIHAAIDARRLGHGLALPRSFLTQAAEDYLSNAEWSALPMQWHDEAFAYCAEPCNGVRGPLTRMRTRRTGNVDRDYYRLADYLEQYGRTERIAELPPGSFWNALNEHDATSELVDLSNSAMDRGLHRQSMVLLKRAAALGDPGAAAMLIHDFCALGISVDEVVRFALEHADFRAPFLVANLIRALQDANATDEANLIAARAVDETSIDDPLGVAALLQAMRSLDRADLIKKIIEQGPAQYEPLDNAFHVSFAIAIYHYCGASDQASILAGRAAVGVPIHDPEAADFLLSDIAAYGGNEEATSMLASRVIDSVSLEPDESLRDLIELFNRSGSTAILKRIEGKYPKNDPRSFAERISMTPFDMRRSALAVARRAAKDAELADASSVSVLLDTFDEIEAKRHLASLLDRNPAETVDVTSIAGVAHLLRSFHSAHAREQMLRLAGRAAKQAPIMDPEGVAYFIEALHTSALNGVIREFLKRDPANQVGLASSSGVADLLAIFRKIRAHRHAKKLLDRAPENMVNLENARGLVSLIKVLRESDCMVQIHSLLKRDISIQVNISDWRSILNLLGELKRAGDGFHFDNIAARMVKRSDFIHPHWEYEIIRSLRELGAVEQSELLEARAANAGFYQEFYVDGPGGSLKENYGREPNRMPSGRWTWSDLS